MTQHTNPDDIIKAMHEAARAENERLSRIMFAASQRNHYTGPPMAECIERFANACGKDGKTMAQLSEILGLPVGTLKGHSRKAQQAGAVRKVQAHQGAIATFYDARGEG